MLNDDEEGSLECVSSPFPTVLEGKDEGEVNAAGTVSEAFRQI